MPKKKKQPKNAYYFFIMEKKKEYERQGTRFYSIQDVFAMEDLRDEYKHLSTSARAKYDQLAKQAKEADKVDLHNKFTNSGESYAQVQERMSQEQREAEFLEELLSSVTMEGPTLNARKFVIFKSIYVAEVGYPPDMEYWPAEFAIGSFSLQGGYHSHWWTLVDTVTVPLGYAAQAKENFEATKLPYPGSHKFKPIYREYAKMLTSLKKFIQCFVQPVKGYYVVFIKPDNEKLVDQGVIQWLVKNARYESREMEDEFYDFFGRLKFLPVTKLLLRLAGVARGRTPTFAQPIAVYGHLEAAAAHVLGSGDYDFSTSITCAYHNLSTADFESGKMNLCCLNIVLRNIFILLRAIIEPMLITPTANHIMRCIKEPPEYQIPRPPQSPKREDTDDLPENPAMAKFWNAKDDSNDAPRLKKPVVPRATESDASTFGASVQGRHADADEDYGSTRSQSTTSSAMDRAWNSGGTPSPGFTKDDFPSLGSGGNPRPAGSTGMGRGRGYAGAVGPGVKDGRDNDRRVPGLGAEGAEKVELKKNDDWFSSAGASGSCRGRGGGPRK